MLQGTVNPCISVLVNDLNSLNSCTPAQISGTSFQNIFLAHIGPLVSTVQILGISARSCFLFPIATGEWSRHDGVDMRASMSQFRLPLLSEFEVSMLDRRWKAAGCLNFGRGRS